MFYTEITKYSLALRDQILPAPGKDYFTLNRWRVLLEDFHYQEEVFVPGKEKPSYLCQPWVFVDVFSFMHSWS